jgi:hypothetical protein
MSIPRNELVALQQTSEGLREVRLARPTGFGFLVTPPPPTDFVVPSMRVVIFCSILTARYGYWRGQSGIRCLVLLHGMRWQWLPIHEAEVAGAQGDDDNDDDAWWRRRRRQKYHSRPAGCARNRRRRGHSRSQRQIETASSVVLLVVFERLIDDIEVRIPGWSSSNDDGCPSACPPRIAMTSMGMSPMGGGRRRAPPRRF